MSYKSFKQLIALLFLLTFFSGKAIARPAPELISGFDILGIKILVDSTLQGVAGGCPVQNEVNQSSSELTQDNSSVKVSRLKLYERFESIQKVFTEDYLKMVAQATYNHEYCVDRPRDVEKEICEQASSILDTYKIELLKLDEIQKEITQSNKSLGSIDLGDDPFMKLIGAPKSVSNLESNLNKHLRRLKSFVEASVKTFKSEFTEEDKRRVFDFHVRALGFLQRSPIQLEGQENLNNRLLGRASKLLGKSGEKTLLSENEAKGKISDLAQIIRKKYLDSTYIAGRNESDVVEEPSHPVMRLSRETIGHQYQEDEPVERYEVWGERQAWEDRDMNRVGAGRRGTGHAVSWPGGRTSRPQGPSAPKPNKEKQKAIKDLKKALSKMSKEELKSLFKELGLLGSNASRSPAGIPLVVAEAIKLLVAAAGIGVASEVLKNFLKDVVKDDDDFKDVTFPPHWAVIENPADKTKKPTVENDKSKGDIEKIDEKLLDKEGLDAHEIKKDALGKKAKISRYDLYKNKKTGEIEIYEKGGKGEPISTGIILK